MLTNIFCCWLIGNATNFFYVPKGKFLLFVRLPVQDQSNSEVFDNINPSPTDKDREYQLLLMINFQWINWYLFEHLCFQSKKEVVEDEAIHILIHPISCTSLLGANSTCMWLFEHLPSYISAHVLLSWLTCCSDRGSMSTSGHKGPHCVLEDSHMLPPSLLPPCMHPVHTHCRYDTLQGWHHPGDRTRNEEKTVRRSWIKKTWQIFWCYVECYSFHWDLKSSINMQTTYR